LSELKQSQYDTEYLRNEVQTLRDRIIDSQMEMKSVADDVVAKLNTLQTELVEAQQLRTKSDKEIAKLKGNLIFEKLLIA
jgi:predicted  nucleic acid-binding Zn-ribbon protein